VSDCDEMQLIATCRALSPNDLKCTCIIGLTLCPGMGANEYKIWGVIAYACAEQMDTCQPQALS